MSNATDQAFPSPGMPYVNAETGIPHDPFAGYGWMVDPRRGLTKREYFAAMAMQGLWANSQTFGPLLQQNPRAVAQWAVESADAMLDELEATKTL